MRIVPGFLFLGVLLSGFLVGLPSRAFAQDPVATCTDDATTNTTTCRIDNPLVTQRMTEYDGASHPELFEAFGHCNLFGCNQRFGVQLPGISLVAKDQITVSADGCVQTGGSGDTWKRYVDPLDPGFLGFGSHPSDSYHGLIGARNAIVKETGETLVNARRIQDFLGKHLWIPVAQPLRLGYEDDNFDDNGYWGHDDGNPAQCTLDGSHGFGANAFVIVTIEHNQPRPATAPPLPWDVSQADPPNSVPPSTDPFDMNALLLNPRWGWQTASTSTSDKQSFNQCNADAFFALHCSIFDVSCRQAALAQCVSQPTTEDTPDLFINSMFGYCGGVIGGGRGHRNWTIVNYHGPLYWSNYSGRTPFQDDDYNFIMQTPTINGFPSGITKENGQHIPELGSDPIVLEFEAQETIDHFGFTPFWRQFHNAVDEEFYALFHGHPEITPAKDMVRHKDAIAIGLLGLDIFEKATSEIHPVFVLAIHTNEDPADDTWAIFARNYGNEGMCSDNMHYADFNTVTLQLPRLAAAPATATATSGPGTKFYANAPLTKPEIGKFFGTDIFLAQPVGPKPSENGDTVITFHLPPTPNDGDDGYRISGELHLQWSAAATPAPAVAAPQLAEATSLAVADASETEPGGPEAKLDALLAQLTPDQMATAVSLAGTDPPVADDTVELVPTFLTNPPSQANAPATPTAVPSPRGRQVAERRGRGICGAFNGRPPAGFGTCDTFSPFTQLTSTGMPNAAGWINTPVTVTLNSFNVSGKGIDHTEYSFDNQNWTRYTTPFTLSDGIFTVFYRSEDQAGAFETSQSTLFKVDTTAPSIAGSRAPLGNANGWNNTDVTVSFACSDSISGLAAGSPPANTLLSAERPGQQVTGVCQDIAGNSASGLVSGINIDKTAPVLLAALNPQPNSNGWNNTDVTVTFTATDVLSGVASITNPITVQSEGQGQVVLGSAADLAGNTSSLSVTVNVDKTPPEIFNQFDPATHDVVLRGRDTLSGVPSGPIAPTSVVPVPRTGERDEPVGTAELRIYKVLDAAGNSLVLRGRVWKAPNVVSVQILTLQYENGPILNVVKNLQAFQWIANPDGSLRLLTQQVAIATTPAQAFVAAYDSTKNETVILGSQTKIVRVGVSLLSIATKKGDLTTEF